MEKANLSYINELSGGDEIFKQKLINIVKQELPQEASQYYNLLEDKNLPELAAIVHKLKHKISILGMTQSYQIAIDYEKALQANLYKNQERFERVLTEMNRFIESI